MGYGANEVSTDPYTHLKTDLLSQNRLYHIAMHVGQTEIAPAVPEGQPGVIESEQMQDGRVEIVDVAFVLDHFHSVIVGFAVSHSAFDSAAGQPRRVGVGEMASPV